MPKTRRLTASPDAIAEAATVLKSGGLVAFPTETVYGLGADATSGEAVARIYAAKQRPTFNPLIAHVADLAAARREGDFSDTALRLAEAFWPGPLTLVVPAAANISVCELARAGLDSVALRVPGHPIAQALIAATGRPIAAPSANRSGRVSPTTADHVLADLDGRIDLVIDGGATPVGVESTILACLDTVPILLRPGGISREAIERLVGPLAGFDLAGAVAPVALAPGLLASHYAPRAALRLAAHDVREEEAVLDFGGRLASGILRLDLSPAGDLVEAAANLFAYLRRLDASGVATIAVAPIPAEGLGEAICDRLRRAAAPR